MKEFVDFRYRLEVLSTMSLNSDLPKKVWPDCSGIRCFFGLHYCSQARFGWKVYGEAKSMGAHMESP